MQVPEFKVLILGDTNLSKKNFCNKLINGNNDYILTRPTSGVDVKPCNYLINNQKIRINLWDCSGNENYKGLGKGYYLNAKGAIIFKDKDNKHEIYEQKILNTCGNIPFILIKYEFDKNINEYFDNINQLINLF